MYLKTISVYICPIYISLVIPAETVFKIFVRTKAEQCFLIWRVRSLEVTTPSKQVTKENKLKINNFYVRELKVTGQTDASKMVEADRQTQSTTNVQGGNTGAEIPMRFITRTGNRYTTRGSVWSNLRVKNSKSVQWAPRFCGFYL